MNCYQRYADLIKTTWTWAFYELERNFDMNEIWVLASSKPWFSLKFLNRRYQRFFIAVSGTRPLQNFGKHSWKRWLSVKFRLAAYAFIGCGFIEQIYINDISIHIEASIQRCSTLLHWTVWHSLAMICFIRLYVFKS